MTRCSRSRRRRTVAALAALLAVGVNVVSAPVAEAAPPDAPTAVVAVAADASASVSWVAPLSDGGSPITSYTVTAIGTNAPAPKVTGLVTTTIVAGLTNGESYTFTVTAANAEGPGPASDPSIPVVPRTVPGPPTGVQAEPDNASAVVTWSAPADDGGSAITSYTVTAIGPNVPAPKMTGAVTATIVSGLTNGASYTFRVAATNDAGTGLASDPSNAVTPVGPPGAPTGVTAVPGNTSANLTWIAPANGGSAITSYTITITGFGGPAPIMTGTAATSRVIGALTNGSSYTFTVRATNGIGTGPDSAPSNAVVPRTIPGAPSGVVAQPGNASAVVTWSAPADNGGSAITSYIVTTHGLAPLPGPVTVAAPATAAAVGGLTNGRSYTFTVKATNAAGTGPDSAASNSVVPRTVPSQPTSVSATAGDGSISVAWGPPADPGGSPVASYTVTVRPLGGTATLVVVDAGTTATNVAGLTNGTPYTVTVSAANGSGSGPGSAPILVVPAPAMEIPVIRARIASGYWMLDSSGTVYAFGAARFLGSPAGQLGRERAVDLESTLSGNGYWILDDAGRVFAYGDAGYLGNLSPAILAAGERASSLSATPSGAGYWIFTSRGRAVPFGDARFFGDMSAVRLNGPVLDAIPTADGNGYFMVGSDGGIFAFGTARFTGSMGGIALNAPVQSLVPDGDGDGYWLVAEDGGIFAFSAPFRGSMGGVKLNRPVTGMVRFGDGYLMVATDGGIFNFSSRPFFGSLGGTPPVQPITAVAALES